MNEYICSSLADHQSSAHCVSSNVLGRDAQIGHLEALDAMHAEVLIYHAHLLHWRHFARTKGVPCRPDAGAKEVFDGHIVLRSVLSVRDGLIGPCLLRDREYIGAFGKRGVLPSDFAAEETHASRHTALFLISPHLGFEVEFVRVRQIPCPEIDVVVDAWAGNMLWINIYQYLIIQYHQSTKA